MDAWHRYLGDAAGVPELRSAGLRSVHPGVRLPITDIPYPTIPREVGESSAPTTNSRQKVQVLSLKMKAMQNRLSNLRATTSRLFGNSFVVEYSDSGDVMAKYSESGNIEVYSNGEGNGVLRGIQWELQGTTNPST